MLQFVNNNPRGKKLSLEFSDTSKAVCLILRQLKVFKNRKLTFLFSLKCVLLCKGIWNTTTLCKDIRNTATFNSNTVHWNTDSLHNQIGSIVVFHPLFWTFLIQRYKGIIFENMMKKQPAETILERSDDYSKSKVLQKPHKSRGVCLYSIFWLSWSS